MTRIDDLVETVRSRSDCTVFPSAGLPRSRGSDILPLDVREFYETCGGMVLFRSADYSCSVLAPGNVLPANPIIVGEDILDDISASWYVIAKFADDEFVTIDLSSERNGQCYDSFHEMHGVAGSSAIVAVGFTDLLEKLIASSGDALFWLTSSFRSLGDAYD